MWVSLRWLQKKTPRTPNPSFLSDSKRKQLSTLDEGAHTHLQNVSPWHELDCGMQLVAPSPVDQAVRKTEWGKKIHRCLENINKGKV